MPWPTTARWFRATPSSWCRSETLAVTEIDGNDRNPKPPPFVRAAAPRPRNVSRDGWWTEPRRPRRPAPVQKVIPTLMSQRDPFGGIFNWDED